MSSISYNDVDDISSTGENGGGPGMTSASSKRSIGKRQERR